MPHAVIVGAGLAGLTAGVILRDKGWSVSVYERKPYLGGACADFNHCGQTVHKFGPHVFHTNYEEVYKFIQRFTVIVPYKHTVLARTDHLHGTLLPIPYNTETERIVGRQLSDEEILDWFFVPYSCKMWGVSWAELPEHIRQRVPQRRDNGDCRYFTDTYQGLPDIGYTSMFSAMADYILDDNKSTVYCDEYGFDWQDMTYDLLVYTGSIDAMFNYAYGTLEYKSLRFSFVNEHTDNPGAINECNFITDATRVSNYDKLTVRPKQGGKSPLVIEYPVPGVVTEHDGGCYYPLPWRGDNLDRYNKYAALVDNTTVLCGRAGAYKYMNMDQVVKHVMDTLCHI